MGVEYLVIVGTLNPGAANFHFRLSFVKGDADGTAVSVRLDPKPAASYAVSQALGLPSLMHACVTVERKTYAYSNKPGTEAFIVSVTRGAKVEHFLRAIFNKHEMDKYV